MRNSDDLARAEAKFRALMSARLRLKQAFERIDYRFDVVKPGLDDLRADAAQGELPEFGSEASS